MIQWMIHRIIWFGTRIAITFIALFAIHKSIEWDGHEVSFGLLCLCATGIIVVVRFWMPPYDSKEIDKDTYWGS